MFKYLILERDVVLCTHTRRRRRRNKTKHFRHNCGNKASTNKNWGERSKISVSNAKPCKFTAQ